MRRAAVLGSPIAHSLSPVLHRAAYAALGIEWTYEAVDVPSGGLRDFLAGCGDEWGGLSLTMPLKVEALPLLQFVEPQARLLGAVNTLLPSGMGEYRQWVGANTDVHGIVAALAEAGATRASTAVIIGGGATATSAMAAVASIGATSPVALVRDRSRAGNLVRAANAMGVRLRTLSLDKADAIAALHSADVVVSTVPAAAGGEIAARIDGTVSGVLLDAVYSPLKTPLGAAWSARGGQFVVGTRMLLHQAGEQVRLMTGKQAPLSEMDRALEVAVAGL